MSNVANVSALERARRLAAERAKARDSSSSDSSASASSISDGKTQKHAKKAAKKIKKKLKKQARKKAKKERKAAKKAHKDVSKRKEPREADDAIDDVSKPDSDSVPQSVGILEAGGVGKEGKKRRAPSALPKPITKPSLPMDRSAGEEQVMDAFAYDPTRKKHVEKAPNQESMLAAGMSPWHACK